MAFPRREFLHLAAAATVLPIASQIARAETHPTSPSLEPPSSEPRETPLAERLAAYADGLRYDDLDDATIERVKVHVVDSLGCGLAAFDEKPAGGALGGIPRGSSMHRYRNIGIHQCQATQ
jgi:2-methylcitrate dehydratase